MKRLINKGTYWIVLDSNAPKQKFVDYDKAVAAMGKPVKKEKKPLTPEDFNIDFGEPFEQEN